MLGALRAKASEARRQLAELTSKYGNRHPAVVTARAGLDDVTRQISAEANRIVAGAENAYRVAASRESSIAQSLEQMKGNSRETGQAEIRLRELSAMPRRTWALYESFLSRFKKHRSRKRSRNAGFADCRARDAAFVPERAKPHADHRDRDDAGLSTQRSDWPLSRSSWTAAFGPASGCERRWEAPC